MRMRKKILSIAAALCIAGSMVCIPDYSEANAASGYVVENLDRGISAISTGSGMMVSWRFLADDSDNSIFKLYRNNALIYTSNVGNATCYLDKDGKSTDTYKVETVESGTVVSSDTCAMQSGSNYLEVKLDVPKAQTSGITYSPNDCTVGDVDGDGQYELFVKWDPSNSKDNSQKEPPLIYNAAYSHDIRL